MNARYSVFPIRLILVLVVTVVLLPEFAGAGEPGKDTRHENLIDADHFKLRIQPMKSQAEWVARKKEIRETLLLRAGLWPMPEKNPLKARIFDERRGDGFTVAKVHFESFPGFLATGNLYRPTKGTPPYPAVITPHGHWQYGRLQNSEAGSIPGRCIDFARMEFVVFSIDMIGYNDSFQLPHDPGKSVAQLKADEPQLYEPRAMRADFDFPEMELYGFNLGGMQLLNGIRSVDFLSGLPDVDPERIGVTGASGGATQTILLMTADDRIKAASPVNIIGVAKHPGCRCENLPGLWLDTSTVEMSAAFSPRPLLLMSATEDPWTPKTPEREYPMIQQYYALDNAEDMVGNVHVDAGHNYNADTRAAVYEWFCKHLNSRFPPIKNPVPVSSELKQLGDLRVFPDRILPEGALSGWQIMRNWKAMSEEAYQELLPKSADHYDTFETAVRGRLAKIMAIDETVSVSMKVKHSVDYGWMKRDSVNFSVDAAGICITSRIYSTGKETAGTILLVNPDSFGDVTLYSNPSSPKPFAEDLLKKGYRIVRLLGHSSWEYFITAKKWDSFSWPDAYNRGNTLNAVYNIVTAIRGIQHAYPGEPVTVIGLGEFGLPATFACASSGLGDRVVVDLNGSDPGYDRELVNLMPYGAIKRVGDFRTAALLLMNSKLVILNPGRTFDNDWYWNQAKLLGFDGNLHFRFATYSTLDEIGLAIDDLDR